MPQLTDGRSVRRVDDELLVEHGAVVGGERAPVVERGFPCLARRRERQSLEVRERRVVGRDHPGARAGFDRHVADRHAAFHREAADRRAAVLDDRTDAAAGADQRDDREHDVLRGDARRELAVDGDRERAGASLRQRLRGEHVLDLAGADAEGERAERAVRGRVAVAAHDRHPREREPLLGTDHVDDAGAGVPHRVEADAELLAVGGEHLDLLLRDRVGDRLIDVQGRHVVVHRRHGEVGAAHGATVQAQAVEGLRRGDLVDEVEVDVEEVGLTVGAADDVPFPHLLGERLGHPAIVACAPGTLSRRFARRAQKHFATMLATESAESA